MSKREKTAKAHYDVIVIGGGLSGMCAAISAARHGAKTALIHGRHVLGGNASSEIRMHVCGASENMAKPDLEEGGILHELMLENKSINDYYNFSIWDMVLFSAIKKEKNLSSLFIISLIFNYKFRLWLLTLWLLSFIIILLFLYGEKNAIFKY